MNRPPKMATDAYKKERYLPFFHRLFLLWANEDRNLYNYLPICKNTKQPVVRRLSEYVRGFSAAG